MLRFNRFGEISNLFWPIALSMFLSSILGFVDSAQISRYNIYAVSSIKFAGQLGMIFGPMYFAVLSGINIYTVQNYARGEYDNLKKYVGIAISIILPLALINTVIGVVFGNQIIGLYVDTTSEVGKMALDYFHIVIFQTIFMVINMIFMYQYRAIKRPKIPLVISVSQTIFNIVLNYILIFGKFGAPSLGIEGAAIATVLARALFVLVNFAVAIKIDAPFLGTLKEMFSFDFKLFKEVLVKTLPLVIVEFGFGLSTSIYTKIYSLAPLDEFTALQIADLSSVILNAFVIATANVAGILIGGSLGKNDEEDLTDTLHNVFTIMLMSSLVIIVLSNVVLPLFIPVFGAQAYSVIIKRILLANSVYMAIRVFSSSIISILKSGGDTSRIILIDSGMSILVGIPALLLTVYLIGPNVVILKTVIILEVVAKFTAGTIRMRKNKWRNVM